jgi:DNA-binding NarL/FixJ family response regulator
MHSAAPISKAKKMRLRCVIVDDDALFLEGASVLLAREGMEVVGVASNSADAIRVVEECRPDVTLIDINLGEENGFDLVQLLSETAGPNSRTILVSTHSFQDFAPLVEASSAAGFVAKSRLSAQAIKEVLDGAKPS